MTLLRAHKHATSSASQYNVRTYSQVYEFLLYKNARWNAGNPMLAFTLHLVRSQDTLIDASLIVCKAPIGWEAAGDIATPRNKPGQSFGTALRALQ